MLPADPRAAPAPYLEPIGELLASVRLLLGAAIDGRLPRDRGLEMGFRLHRYWAATDVTEGRFWLSRLLAGQPRMTWTGRATYALGYLDYWSGDSELAVRELQTAVDLLNEAAEPDEYAARALIYLGGLADDLDRGAEALSFVRRSISAAAPFGVDLQVARGDRDGLRAGRAGRPGGRRARGRRDRAVPRRPARPSSWPPPCRPRRWSAGRSVTWPRRARYIAEAQPLLGGTRRIARVVLQTAAAGVALAQGDAGAAIELGSSAAGDASALGIAREQPLPSAIVARAWLERGDLAAAAQHALAAVTAARSLAFAFPLAVGLETTALIALDGGLPSGPELPVPGMSVPRNVGAGAGRSAASRGDSHPGARRPAGAADPAGGREPGRGAGRRVGRRRAAVAGRCRGPGRHRPDPGPGGR